MRRDCPEDILWAQNQTLAVPAPRIPPRHAISLLDPILVPLLPSCCRRRWCAHGDSALRCPPPRVRSKLYPVAPFSEWPPRKRIEQLVTVKSDFHSLSCCYSSGIDPCKGPYSDEYRDVQRSPCFRSHTPDLLEQHLPSQSSPLILLNWGHRPR